MKIGGTLRDIQDPMMRAITNKGISMQKKVTRNNASQKLCGRNCSHQYHLNTTRVSIDDVCENAEEGPNTMKHLKSYPKVVEITPTDIISTQEEYV